MKEVESWAKVVWRLKGGILVAFFHEDLMFFEFTLPKEALRANDGTQKFKGRTPGFGEMESRFGVCQK